ncbi:AbrB/MazE/SpoVT family DNA-binding domain-containing protein [Sulfuriferula nivalis]|jgi:AbrB family looped-hinge helix DNA binding protein|uniref:AbrB family transcriptional regulator n=1 Tax=Sulfuriferula nivalis TaxID=2675298 RepID=A0A809RE38_9PROT|nr:AbrB/MazE/SpoVT family DNA-binding domain-containing protein [Sulfuriferula nivalis]BBO99905.1 AbrB family transcriptional regulator [Sulfuriferula nivalis]
MTTATVTSKGQITIPINVRSSLGLNAGDRIEFVEMDDGQFAIIPATHPVTALKGLIRKPVQSVSIEQMNAVIAQYGASTK